MPRKRDLLSFNRSSSPERKNSKEPTLKTNQISINLFNLQKSLRAWMIIASTYNSLLSDSKLISKLDSPMKKLKKDMKEMVQINLQKKKEHHGHSSYYMSYQLLLHCYYGLDQFYVLLLMASLLLIKAIST